MQISRPNLLIVAWHKVFRDIVCQVFLSRLPLYDTCFQEHLVYHPKESHLH